jgi:hypothetical protein
VCIENTAHVGLKVKTEKSHGGTEARRHGGKAKAILFEFSLCLRASVRDGFGGLPFISPSGQHEPVLFVARMDVPKTYFATKKAQSSQKMPEQLQIDSKFSSC